MEVAVRPLKEQETSVSENIFMKVNHLLVKAGIILSLLIVLLFMQCNSPQKRSVNGVLPEHCPINDLLTEVPALDEDSIFPVVLENDAFKAVFDKNTGRLVSLLSKNTGWEIQHRGYLSRSFRLAVPVPGRRDNCVYGEKQAPCVTKVIDDKKVIFAWDKLSSNCDKELDISFTGTVELTEQGLRFTAEIDNRSPFTVETVYWPYIGDLGVPKTQNMLGFGGETLYPFFRNHRGYYGVDYPIQLHQTLPLHFGLLSNNHEGMYVCYDDTTDECLVDFTFELKPGFEYAESMDYGTVPKTDSIGGKPAHIEFSCIHFAYVNPKESMILKPIIFQPYVGDWQKGADIYKKWRSAWTRTLPCPEWAKKVHSWQQFHINSSEDYPRSSYKNLVEYAKQCAKHGVKAIQLTGWNLGGQDRGNPSHDIDPMLGTWDELKDAIAACKKMGVHIVLFSKFTWADESQPWFEKKLKKYAVKDPYGNYVDDLGYQYQTAVQLAGLNTRRFIPICTLSPQWRKVADNEFNKLIELGAAGMLYDECQHHGGAVYCFDPTHGHRVPANVYSGDRLLESGFRRITQQKDPEFLFAGEAVRDLQFRSYNISYFRIGEDHVPFHRYIAPDAAMMIAIIGFNDRNPINQALLYRYILSYEPRNFKGKLEEFPLTIAYGVKVDALREKYSDFLWEGEFTGTVGATMKVKNGAGAYYSVFINHKTGKKAIVVANPSYDQTAKVEVQLENGKREFLMASPEVPDGKESNGKIDIPLLSAVVLMEK